MYILIMQFDVKKYCADFAFLDNAEKFNEMALQAFRFQYETNAVYREYCNYLKICPERVQKLEEIPFMPVEFFKTHKIVCGNAPAEIIFTSSSTTGAIPSSHYVTNVEIYKQAFCKGFREFYGNPEEFCILGLLPAYLERKGSSLVFMVDELIKMSQNKLSGFFLHNHKELYETILQLESNKSKYLLIGVSFGLLDFAEEFTPEIKNGIVMETGGMKGRRKEMVRSELHEILQKSFGVENIHSEYGMTELLSQAYSQGNGIYRCSSTMKVMIRETNDPLSVHSVGSGAINIIDLANINSCCFLQTSDLGQVFEDKSFTISGRFDNADVRGCNLMVVQ